MNFNKFATLFLLLTFPAPTDAIFSIFASIILFFTGFFGNICNTALDFFPDNLGCQCSSGLTSTIFGFIVTGASLDIDDCSLVGDLDADLSVTCQGGFNALGPLVSIFSQDFLGNATGTLDCAVVSSKPTINVDHFTLEVNGEVDLSLDNPSLTLTSYKGTIRDGGLDAAACVCNVNDENGVKCPGEAEITFSCTSIGLNRTCVNIYGIAP